MPVTKAFVGRVDRLEILDKDGTPDKALDPNLPKELLEKMYSEMVLARTWDRKCIALQRTGRMYTYAPIEGQEAISIGCALAADQKDWLFPTYREAATLYNLRGHDKMKSMLIWMGLEEGLDLDKKIRCFPLAIPIATQLVHAVGAAYAMKLEKDNGIAITFGGDGSTSEGDFHDACNFAAELDVPVLFLISNNQYAISVPRKLQTRSETIAQKALAYGFDGLQVDGNDILAVYTAIKEIAAKARKEKKPMLIEFTTYRIGPHTTADDPKKYRSPEEAAQWLDRDPIKRLAGYLKLKGFWSEEFDKKVHDDATKIVEDAVAAAEKFVSDPKNIFKYTYENMTPEFRVETNERVLRGIQMKMNMVEAINSCLKQEMEKEEKVVVLGEDVGVDGGVFRVTEGLFEKFGRERVIDTPLSESGIIGTAIGMAAFGLRPVAEIQFQGFEYNAYHQFVQHAARLRNRTRGKFDCPMVVRLPYSGGIRALEHHSESLESVYIHIPGLTVVCPSTPYDAKGLLASAIRCNDTVLYFEPKRLYRAFKTEVPEEEYTIPIGKANIISEGKDLTLISWGAYSYVSKEAIEEATKQGVSIEHIDLRTLSPCDWETITKSVKKTGRCVIVHEATKTLGFGAEIATRVMEESFLSLEAPIKRVTGWDITIPYPKQEDYYFPDKKRILEGIMETIKY